MKKIIKKIKYILLLFILSFFPIGISALIEFIITGGKGDCNITFDYLIFPLNLIAVIISLYVFKEKKIINVKNEFNPKLTMLCFLMGFTFQQIYVLLLKFLGANIIISKIYYFSIFTAVFVAPIAEELQYRVILTDIINEKKQTVSIITIFLTSLIWTCTHFRGISIGSLILIIAGFFLGTIYQKTRNVLACIMFHMGANLSHASFYIICRYKNIFIFDFIISVLIFVLCLIFFIKNYFLMKLNHV